MYSFMLCNGYIRFYCKYDGKRQEKCLHNENGVCNIKYLFYPELLINRFDGKNSIKCAVNEGNI